MIPKNRPVLGKDLDAVRTQYGLLVSDACWLFGLSITRWMQIVKRAGDEPVSDPTLALLVRFLADHPELSVIPKFPTVPEMYEMVNGVTPTDQKRFSVLLGSEASATYRWLRVPGSRQSPAVNRLMHYLKVAMLSQRPNERGQLLEDWKETVDKEAKARGVVDVFKTGGWNPNKKAKAKKEEEASEAVEGGEAAAVKKPRARKAPAKTAAAPAAEASKAAGKHEAAEAAPAKKTVRRVPKASVTS
ncbi:hypothetical protein [Methylibium petroleiphilum]|uniref:hypothetical protein n=1 Tax=Methylibium petroleiphilum TaxID=105560 RepID=UPI0004187CFF|nr:hypothetical protein [Methylibium petroleiphilum]